MNFEEDTFGTQPIRYELDDYDSDEELEASVQMNKVTLKFDIAAETLNSKWTLLFGLEGPGNVFINSLENEETTVIGTVSRVVEGEETITKANIMQVSDKPVLLISFNGEIVPEESVLYAKSIISKFNNNVEKVVVLDAFTATGYISATYDENMTPPFVRVLQTSKASIISGLALYESPNMIKGLAAAIINYCEVYSIPCYDLLTLQESIYGALLVTEEVLYGYKQPLEKLGLNFSINENKMNKVLEAQRNGRISDNHHRLYL